MFVDGISYMTHYNLNNFILFDKMLFVLRWTALYMQLHSRLDSQTINGNTKPSEKENPISHFCSELSITVKNESLATLKKLKNITYM